MSPTKVKKCSTKKQRQFHFVNYQDGHGLRFKGSNREMRQHVMLDVLARSTDNDKKEQALAALVGDGPQLPSHDLDRGRRLDDFGVLPKSHPSVNIEHLKRNCIEFFACDGMTKYWTSRALQDDLFFKSSLCVTAAHEDALYNRYDNRSTLALETDVVGLLKSRYNTMKAESPEALVESILNIASAGNYSCNEMDSVVHGHYNEIESMLASTTHIGDMGDENILPKLILVNALIFAATREREPHPSFLTAARELNVQTNYIPNDRFQSYTSDGYYSNANVIALNGRSWLRVELLHVMKTLVNSLLSKRADSNYYALKTSLRQRFQLLPGADDPTHEGFRDHTYESCRLAVLALEEAAYNARSLSECASNTNLPAVLRDTLLKADVDRLRAELGSILLWILLIGAAAARFSSERSWFIAQLMKTALVRAFSQGEAVIGTLCRFLEVQNALTNSLPWAVQS